jgi:type IV pilus assembly protein PilY1
MKAKLQSGIALTALAGLLSGPAAQATDVADLPLKASVLAKPTVIFGMDDSGSMDWEVLLDTNSGLLWWNGVSAWDSTTGKPLRSSDKTPYAYLFPLGSNTGGQLYAYDNYYGQAVPPTNEFAWLRASHFNPLYYDSMVTYAPWSPAYVDNDGDTDDDGSKISYANASTSNALSHPLYSSGPKLAVGSSWTSSNSLFDDNGYMFRVQGGMKLPVGTYVYAQSTTSGVCRASGTGKSATWTWRTLTAEVTVEAGLACWAGIPYFPATFWHAESCTVGTDCVTGPDGSTKLKRYEIKTGNTFPSGRSVTDELQNFANWFTYYRKRKLMLAGSMGEVLEGLTGLRLGVVPFNSHTTVKMYDTDKTANNVNGLAVAGLFYRNGLSGNGTPTHATVKHIASQFEGNTNIVKYACQRNSMFIVTDGFSNTTSIEVPTYDAATYGATAPYTTTPTGSLADLALSYYTNRLRAADTALPAGKVPTSSSTLPNADKNPNLHINTYAISLGVRGSLWPHAEDYDPFVTPPTWPTPVADDPSMIDDQWHATINGRGLMFLASNPAETAAGIQKVLDDIISQTGAQGGVAVSTVNLSRGDSRAYFGTYDPAGWRGDLAAYPIDAATGEVSAGAADKIWSAADKLDKRDWTNRIIGTASTSAGVAFTSDNVADAVNPSDVYGADADVINYLRGDRSKEAPNGDLRTRLSRMGAVINSEPAVQRSANVVYVQSGEGMLHAIDTAAGTAGTELWAFVPRAVLANIGQTVERGYVFSTQLDGSPTLGTYAGGTLLVAGMGAAGRSFHALNVSNPRGWTEASFADTYEWEFPGASDTTTAAKVGQALGRPRIVKTAGDGYVVLVTSGYNSTADGHGRLWMLNASTGEVIHEFDTGVGDLTSAEGGLAQVSAFLEDDGNVRYVYGGDLLGNLWRFDLQDKGTPHLLAVLKSSTGVAQPVTAAPELMMAGDKRVVLIGTGRLLDIGDFGNTGVQSFYAIADGTTLSTPRSSLVQQTYTPSTDTITQNVVNWATDRGWFMDLPAGQQANTQPSLAYGAVAFTTNTAGGTDCSASSRLYVLDVLTGSKYSGTDFVSSEISSTANSSGVTALLTSKGKIVGSGQDADGKPWERDIAKNSKIDPAKNSWREIRR